MYQPYSDSKIDKKNNKSEYNSNLKKKKNIKKEILHPMYKKYCYLEKAIYKCLKNSFLENDGKSNLNASGRFSMLKALILLGKEKEILAEKINIDKIKMKKSKKLRKKMKERKEDTYKEMYREIKNKMKLFSYSNNGSKESPKNMSRREKEKQEARTLRGENLYYNEKEDLLTSSDKNEILKLKEEHILLGGSTVRIYNSFIENKNIKKDKSIEADNIQEDNKDNEKTICEEDIKEDIKEDIIILFKQNGKLFQSTIRNVYYSDFLDTS